MSTPGTQPRGTAVLAVVGVAGLALGGHLAGGGLLLLLASAALLVALLARRSGTRTGRAARRVGLWLAVTVVSLPLLFGLLVALGGVLSEDFRAGGEDSSTGR